MVKLSVTKRAILTTAVWLSLGLTVNAQVYRAPDLQQRAVDRAYQKLLRARIFNFGGVGYGQTITEEEIAFRIVFESADAEKVFAQLVREADLEGQLYGLFGIHLKAPANFAAAAQMIHTDPGPALGINKLRFLPDGKVRTGRGCLLFEQDVETVIAEITHGDWDAAFYSHVFEGAGKLIRFART